MTRPLLLVPGWQNSGPDHWQSLWEAARPGARRVLMPDWEIPDPLGWEAALDAAIATCAEPPLIAAHSLGCIALVRWAERHARPVHGALLAAPADVARPGCPEVLRGFAPIPSRPLPFPGHLVAAEDDPYLTPARAEFFASTWGIPFTLQPGGGHLNAAAGFGPWPLGEALMARLGG